VSSGGGGVSVEHGDGGGTAQTGGTNPGGGTTSSGSSGDGSTNLAGQVSSGPRSPGTVGEDTSVGNRSWNNATNVLVSDGAYGYMSGGGLPQGYYLKLTNFGFNIPIDATISGIKVESELYSTNPNDHDASIKLVKDGLISGTDKADLYSFYSLSEETRSYGGDHDLWGLSLSPTNINNSNFGVVLSVIANASGPVMTVYVDNVRIIVYYTPALSTNTGGGLEASP
jgi:hypothetical protein